MSPTGVRSTGGPDGSAGFTGFGERAPDFFAGLEADNSKAYWEDHRATYERDVREPMLALLAALEPEFGAGRMFRPYRDVRFSKDKAPYKTSAAATAGGSGGGSRGEAASLYVHLDADGLLAGGGAAHLAADQLGSFRRAVDDDVAGAALDRVVAALETDGYALGGDQLRTRPRGWAADHPRLDLLRRRGLYAYRQWEPAPWLHTAGCLDRVAAAWRAAGPLGEWLATHVGASAETR